MEEIEAWLEKVEEEIFAIEEKLLSQGDLDVIQDCTRKKNRKNRNGTRCIRI